MLRLCLPAWYLSGPNMVSGARSSYLPTAAEINQSEKRFEWTNWPVKLHADSFARPPVPLEITMGNPALSWVKWKPKFEIYLKAIWAAKKHDEMKMGLLLNHMGESCLEINSNFIFLSERDVLSEGEGKFPAEDPDNFATVMAKFNECFQKRDPQLMLREKFWVDLKREPTQTFDSWVVTVKERAAEFKFPANFYEQAVKDKLTFSCLSYMTKEQPFHSAVKILPLKEAAKRELQESKTAEIECHTARE